MLALFGDLATELLIRLDGDEGLFRAYESIEFSLPSSPATTSRRPPSCSRWATRAARCGSRRARSSANVRGAGLAPSAADVLDEPVVVTRAIGTCVVPRELQRRSRELYMPGLPAGPAPGAQPIVTRPSGADLVLTAAIVGAELTRAQTPHLPLTAQEVADEARGAARPARRSSTFTSATTTGPTPSRPSASPRSSTPSAASATASSSRRRAAPSACRSTSARARSRASPRWRPSTAAPSISATTSSSTRGPTSASSPARSAPAGALPELECYEVGHVEEALSLAAEGVIGAPLHFQFVLGVRAPSRRARTSCTSCAPSCPPTRRGRWRRRAASSSR